MTLDEIKAAYPAIVARLRVENGVVKLQGATRNKLSNVVAVAAKHYMSQNPGIDYNAAVKATAGEDYMASVVKDDQRAVATNRMELAAIDAVARLYMSSNPGADYVAAIKATAGANYMANLTQDKECAVSARHDERVALDSAARRYMAANPGSDYLSALKAVGAR